MAKIVFLEGPFTGHELEIPDEGINIGRSQRCALTIPDGKISGEHAMLRQEDGSWWVYDLQSSNGTYVNGNPVQAVRIGENDRIALGESVFTMDFSGHEAKASEGGSALLKTGGTPGASQPETYVSRPHKEKPQEKSAETAAATSAEPNQDDLQTIKDLNAAYESMRTQIGRVIIGQAEVVEQLLIAIFCRGHALLVGVPGLAKTLLVHTLGHVLDLSFKRVQFTPDLMPSDITGTDVLEEDRTTGKRVFRFVRGPLFTNLLLADEINRTPPKTQAALLEAMQEHHVTVGENTYHLPEPFFVLATQNPIEQEGTYPLPEAQLDRFMFNIVVNYPSAAEESEIIKQVTGTYAANLDVTLSADDVLRLQQVVRRVPVADHVVNYARDLARATRPKEPEAPDFVKEMVAWGAGPRAGIYLIMAAKAHAILHGRYHATTVDVSKVALPVLRHRVLTTFNAEAAGVTSDEIVARLIDQFRPKDDLDI